MVRDTLWRAIAGVPALDVAAAAIADAQAGVSIEPDPAARIVEGVDAGVVVVAAAADAGGDHFFAFFLAGFSGVFFSLAAWTCAFAAALTASVSTP